MRVTMAIQAGAHGERGHLGHHRHLADIPVAVLAPNAATYMDHMREINKIGEPVNSFPEDGLASCRSLTEPDDAGFVDRCGLVAVHAGGQ